jgi:hypothetical protein
MENFLKTYDLLDLNQENINKPNRSPMNNDIEAIIKESPNKEKPRIGWIPC